MISHADAERFVMYLQDNAAYPQDGWYFADECEQMVGPYETREAALAACLAYVP